VRGCLVGQNVRNDAALSQFRNHVRAIPDEPDGNIFLFANRILQDAQRFIERGDHEIAVAGLEALLDALGIDVDAEKRRASHRCSKWLSSAHAAHAATHNQLAGQVAAEMLLSRGGKSLERSLHDAL
jgi:hypothetical protein